MGRGTQTIRWLSRRPRRALLRRPRRPLLRRPRRALMRRQSPRPRRWYRRMCRQSLRPSRWSRRRHARFHLPQRQRRAGLLRMTTLGPVTRRRPQAAMATLTVQTRRRQGPQVWWARPRAKQPSLRRSARSRRAPLGAKAAPSRAWSLCARPTPFSRRTMRTEYGGVQARTSVVNLLCSMSMPVLCACVRARTRTRPCDPCTTKPPDGHACYVVCSCTQRAHSHEK